MKHILLSAALTLAGLSAAAQPGTYRIVEASTPDGSEYTGTVTVVQRTETPSGADAEYTVTWTTNAGNYTGIGLQMGKYLFVGYGTGRGYGVSVLRYLADEGKWAGECRAAASSPDAAGFDEIQAGANLPNGSFAATRMQGGQPLFYNAKVRIQQAGEVYQLTWATPTGTVYGIGIREGDYLVVGWGRGPSAGVVSYTLAGGKWVGRYAPVGGTEVSPEVLAK